MASQPKICPTCKQPLPRADHRRVCANCHNPIGRHHKWYFATVDGQTIIMHRDCENPTQYEPEERDKARNQMELA